jgi:RNA polymerase sigma factor (sigma-70 family)
VEAALIDAIDRIKLLPLQVPLIVSALDESATTLTGPARGSTCRWPRGNRAKPRPRARKGAKLLALHEALLKLEQQDPAKAQLVKLRYFAGLSIRQAAEALGISTATADRYWAYSRAWLQRKMTVPDGKSP